MHSIYIIEKKQYDMNIQTKCYDDALKGKVIVVTGGGSGLGKLMTKYFMELGAKVTSRDLLASELESETGGTCLTM
jgi:short-subunit dehydrogenase